MLASVQGDDDDGTSRLDTGASSSKPPAPLPSHTLAISFLDSPNQPPLLLPAHGLVWAFATPRLAHLSTLSQNDDASIPIPIELPCAMSFHLLLSWIYTASAEKLLQSIICARNETLPSTLEETIDQCKRQQVCWIALNSSADSGAMPQSCKSSTRNYGTPWRTRGPV